MNDDKYTKYSRGLSELHERTLLVLNTLLIDDFFAHSKSREKQALL